MLLEQKVKIKWISNNKQYYECKGYKYTCIGDEFEVDIEDLLKGTSAKVKVKCDVCNNVYESNYSNYVRKKQEKDYCKNNYHCQEYYEKIYRNYDCNLLEIFKNNTTNMRFICYCGEYSEKTFNEFTRNPGCKKCTHNKRINHLKYSKDDIINICKENDVTLITPIENYNNAFTKMYFKCKCGSEFSRKLIKVKNGQNKCKKCSLEISSQKIRESLLLHGDNIRASKQQRYIFNLLKNIKQNVFLNYQVDYYFPDIAFKDEKIYIEYDGGLHDAGVKFGKISKKEFDAKEQNRKMYLMRKGWKEIRIKSSCDLLPSDEEIISFIDKAKCYLETGRHWITLDIDNKKVICSQYEKDIDFYILRTIKKEMVN